MSKHPPPRWRPILRIVSLLISAIELICGLGLRHKLAGVKHECDLFDSVVWMPVLDTTHILVARVRDLLMPRKLWLTPCIHYYFNYPRISLRQSKLSRKRTYLCQKSN